MSEDSASGLGGGCVNLGKLFNLPWPQFPHLYTRGQERLDEGRDAQRLVWCLVGSRGPWAPGDLPPAGWVQHLLGVRT